MATGQEPVLSFDALRAKYPDAFAPSSAQEQFSGQTDEDKLRAGNAVLGWGTPEPVAGQSEDSVKVSPEKTLTAADAWAKAWDRVCLLYTSDAADE